MKMRIVCQVFEHGIRTTAGLGQLHRTLPKPAFKFVEINIEPSARIADNDDGFRLHMPARLGPEVAGVVQGRLVA